MTDDELDDLSGVPRYVQVARAVAAEIEAGTWQPGGRAPSRNDLAQRFGVARETAARAHKWLSDRGYVVAVPGVGQIVTPRERWQRELAVPPFNTGHGCPNGPPTIRA